MNQISESVFPRLTLISLNLWGGQLLRPIIQFLKDTKETDIFCFQEIYSCAKDRMSLDNAPVCLDLMTHLQKVLPDHEPFFSPVWNETYGIAIFIKKSLTVVEKGTVGIYINPAYQGKGPAHNRSVQWITLKISNKDFRVINIHGLWNGQGKGDSPERIKQSQVIKNLMNNSPESLIVCGDFNLRPDTKSFSMISEGMTDWIKLSNVKSTRTSLYPKEERYADYILTSPDVSVSLFQVLEHEVSDHSPLKLIFQIN